VGERRFCCSAHWEPRAPWYGYSARRTTPDRRTYAYIFKGNPPPQPRAV